MPYGGAIYGSSIYSEWLHPDVDLTDPDNLARGMVESHCELAKSRLAEQFKGKVNFEALICLLGDRIQDLEQELANTWLFRSIATAVGAQLDRIGIHLRTPRNGTDDEDYRERLSARAIIVGSRGTPDELLLAALALDDGDDPSSIVFIQTPPAAFQLYFTVPAGEVETGWEWGRILRAGQPAGVNGHFYFHERSTTLFSWAASAADPSPPADSGWFEGTGLAGTWAEVV